MSRRHTLHRWISIGFVLLLAACGGGGGGGGGGDGGHAAVTVPARAYTVTAHYDDELDSTASIDFSLAQVPDAGIAVLVDSASDAVTDAQIDETGPTTGTVRVTLAPGHTMGAGEHAVTVQLSFCYDDACTRHVAGSPATVTLNYDVRPEERKVRIEVDHPSPAHGLVSETTGPVATGVVRVINPPAEGVHIDLLPGSSLADGVGETIAADGHHLNLQLRSPRSLGLGRFTDNPYLKVCFGSDCSRARIVGFPKINIDYTVTSVAVQDVRSIDLHVNDMAWDPVRGWIVLALDSAFYIGSSNRGVLDPRTGGFFIAPTGGPTLEHLTLSPDGQSFAASAREGWYLYRFKRDDLTAIDQQYVWSQPGDLHSDLAFIKGLAYGSDGTLAMLTTNSNDFGAPQPGVELRLLDGAATRAGRYVSQDPPPFSSGLCSFAWQEDARSILVSDSSAGLRSLDVTSAGVASSGTVLNADYSCIGDAQLSSGRLFTRDGFVYDAADAHVEKRIGVEFGMTGEVQDVAVDPALRRVYVLHTLSTDEAGDARISAYDLDSLAHLDSVVLRQAGMPRRMIRWGARGLAVSNSYGKMLLLEGGIVDGS